MGGALVGLLLATLVSPLAWASLLTGTVTLELMALIAVAGGWLLWARTRGWPFPLSTVVVFGAALVWTEGTLLWLTAPVVHWWHALPIALMAMVGLWGLHPELEEPGESMSIGVRALLWGGIALAMAVGLSGTQRGGLAMALALLPLLALPWSLPRCLAEVARPPHTAMAPLGAVFLMTAVVLTAAGHLQSQRVTHLFWGLSQDPEPWTSDWTPAQIEPLLQLQRRFPQPGGEALIETLRGLAALRVGHSEEAQRHMVEALAEEPMLPAAVAATAHTLGRLGMLEPLVALVGPAQVIASGSLEAARHSLGARIAAGQFGLARVIHTRFGDDLFVRGHPVLTAPRIGAALAAWGRSEEALQWFSDVTPDPWESAESLFWRGIAESDLGHADRAREAWETALRIAPGHADARAHLEGTARALRAAPDLMSNPVAGRQLVGVHLIPVSPESTDAPHSLEPGQVYDVECEWRLTHLTPELLEVRLRLSNVEIPLMHLGSTIGMVRGGSSLHLGERVTTSGRVQIPEVPSTSPEEVELLVTTANGSALPRQEVVALSALSGGSGFQEHDPRNAREGISAARRIAIFGRGCRALGLGGTFEGTDSALVTLEEPIAAGGIGVISTLSRSQRIEDGAIVAELFVSDQEGHHHVFPLLAGRDTADIWHQYPGNPPRHRRAPVAWESERESGGHRFAIARYHTSFDFGEELTLRAIRLRTHLLPGAELHVEDLVTLPAPPSAGVGENN